MSNADFSPNDWRHKDERSELVERIINQDRKIRALTQALRDVSQERFDDPSVGALIAGYAQRCVELEDIVERANKRLADRRTA